MSEAKHTPGPWRVGPIDDTIVTDAKGNEVAAIDGDYNEPNLWPVMEANARLIAAAPAMYEALNDLYAWAEKQAGDRFPAELGRARAALSLAEGK